MKRLRTWFLVAVLATAVPVLPACHAPVTVVTPEGKAAFTANEILTRVERLQDAAVAAQKNGSLATERARTIVFAAVQIAEIADAATKGWEATARQAWAQAKAEVADLQPGGRFATLAAAIDEVLGGGV